MDYFLLVGKPTKFEAGQTAQLFLFLHVSTFTGYETRRSKAIGVKSFFQSHFSPTLLPELGLIRTFTLQTEVELQACHGGLDFRKLLGSSAACAKELVQRVSSTAPLGHKSQAMRNGAPATGAACFSAGAGNCSSLKDWVSKVSTAKKDLPSGLSDLVASVWLLLDLTSFFFCGHDPKLVKKPPISSASKPQVQTGLTESSDRCPV